MVVRSLYGHDRETLFAVLKADEKYVYVTDGKHRPLEKPKRKNPKHLKLTGFIINQMSSNRKIRKSLKTIECTSEDLPRRI